MDTQKPDYNIRRYDLSEDKSSGIPLINRGFTNSAKMKQRIDSMDNAQRIYFSKVVSGMIEDGQLDFPRGAKISGTSIGAMVNESDTSYDEIIQAMDAVQAIDAVKLSRRPVNVDTLRLESDNTTTRKVNEGRLVRLPTQEFGTETKEVLITGKSAQKELETNVLNLMWK